MHPFHMLPGSCWVRWLACSPSQFPWLLPIRFVKQLGIWIDRSYSWSKKLYCMFKTATSVVYSNTLPSTTAVSFTSCLALGLLLSNLVHILVSHRWRSTWNGFNFNGNPSYVTLRGRVWWAQADVINHLLGMEVRRALTTSLFLSIAGRSCTCCRCCYYQRLRIFVKNLFLGE
jgi:hypothetical protein